MLGIIVCLMAALTGSNDLPIIASDVCMNPVKRNSVLCWLCTCKTFKHSFDLTAAVCSVSDPDQISCSLRSETNADLEQ